VFVQTARAYDIENDVDKKQCRQEISRIVIGRKKQWGRVLFFVRIGLLRFRHN